MAAVLACGPGAALSHRSAAAHWGFGKEHSDYIDVSVIRDSESRLPGLRCHRRPNLSAEAISKRLNIPLTQPVQTFLDLATVSGPKTLERAINEADKHDVLDPDALRKALDAHPGEPGVRPLLPTPLTKVKLNDFEVDFFWPSLGLVVETDGWRYHRTPSAQTRDALRFQEHTAAGLPPLRFSHWQVKHEPRHVQNILRRTTANLRGLPAPLPAQ
jgi:hypothetical protein